MAHTQFHERKNAYSAVGALILLSERSNKDGPRDYLNSLFSLSLSSLGPPHLTRPVRARSTHLQVLPFWPGPN